jgi:aminoglycoside phosphotransferase (APT) family kinase protein
MKTGITITEATEECAFLTNTNGYDVAFLRRIVPQGHPDIPEAEMLTGEQWQALIDQIAAALAPTPTTAWQVEEDEGGTWSVFAGSCGMEVGDKVAALAVAAYLNKLGVTPDYTRIPNPIP